MCPNIRGDTSIFKKKLVYDGEYPIYLIETDYIPYKFSLTKIENIELIKNIKETYFSGFPTIGVIDEPIASDHRPLLAILKLLPEKNKK